MSKCVLITGGAGFIGSHLANRLMNEGHDVLIFDSLVRPGVERNLAWLQERHPRIKFAQCDIRGAAAVTEAVKNAQVVFHIAGQVAVTTSINDPRLDYEVNIGGTLNVLEAVRTINPEAPVIFASTNKVYGDLRHIRMVDRANRWEPADLGLRENGIGESQPLSLLSPYGCSKGAADQYVLDYAHTFGLKTAVLRMSCIYGPRQFGTTDQGWVAHFARQAISEQIIKIYGDGHQVRDVLHVDDAVCAYIAAWQHIDNLDVCGRAFNLGGGPPNAISLHEAIDYLEELLDCEIPVLGAPERTADQKYFVADTSAALAMLCWYPCIGWKAGIQNLVEWLQSNP